MSEIILAGKFKVGKKLGSGSFGDIYFGTNIQTSEVVAVKVEKSNIRQPQLVYESRILQQLGNICGVPRLFWFGSEGTRSVMVTELLGSSLEDLFNACSRRFSLKTVLMLADQMLERVEYVHSQGFLHRDMKPDNFLVGRDKQRHLVYLIDFGLAKRFQDRRTGAHIPMREGKNLTGTARYASVNTHLGIEQGRRDDLEGLGYIFLYFLRGSLPWQGLYAKTKLERYRKIKEKKQSTSVEALCDGYPHAFVEYLQYCSQLGFEDLPDYAYLRQLLRSVFVDAGFELDYAFDWTLGKSPSVSPGSALSETRAKASDVQDKPKKKKKNCQVF